MLQGVTAYPAAGLVEHLPVGAIDPIRDHQDEHRHENHCHGQPIAEQRRFARPGVVVTSSPVRILSREKKTRPLKQFQGNRHY
jgi:hypothetical protein